MITRRIGFSTGAVSKGDFLAALEILDSTNICVIELSALRFHELEPLAKAIPNLKLSKYEFVSVHAPSAFSPSDELSVVGLLKSVTDLGYPVVIHPDVIYDPKVWATFGALLYVENMDQRKFTGRTRQELAEIFKLLPDAKLCFDAGHARNVDTSMSQAAAILEVFGERLGQIHLSSVNTLGLHESFTFSAIQAFREIANLIPQEVPIILESPVSREQIEGEDEVDEMLLSP